MLISGARSHTLPRGQVGKHRLQPSEAILLSGKFKNWQPHKGHSKAFGNGIELHQKYQVTYIRLPSTEENCSKVMD